MAQRYQTCHVDGAPPQTVADGGEGVDVEAEVGEVVPYPPYPGGVRVPVRRGRRRAEVGREGELLRLDLAQGGLVAEADDHVRGPAEGEPAGGAGVGLAGVGHARFLSVSWQTFALFSKISGCFRFCFCFCRASLLPTPGHSSGVHSFLAKRRTGFSSLISSRPSVFVLVPGRTSYPWSNLQSRQPNRSPLLMGAAGSQRSSKLPKRRMNRGSIMQFRCSEDSRILSRRAGFEKMQFQDASAPRSSGTPRV